MDLQALKLDLVSKIIKIEKPALLIEIDKILQKDSNTDWWDRLPEAVQDSILEGMDDVRKGNILTHEQTMQEAKEKYGL